MKQSTSFILSFAFITTISSVGVAETIPGESVPGDSVSSDSGERVEIEPDGRKLFPASDTEVGVAESFEQPELEWASHWRRAGSLELGIGLGSIAGGYGFEYVMGTAHAEPRFIGGFMMDDSIGASMIGDNTDNKTLAGNISDAGLYSLIAVPMVINPLVAGLGHGNWDVASQLSLIGIQSIGLTTGVVNVIKSLVGRKRPSANGDNLSFPSGHSAVAFTGAGLVCATTESLPLFGEGFVGDLPCYLAEAAAVTTATMRIVAEKHYFTDVTIGAIIGTASGYLLPKLAYFRGSFGSSDFAGSVLPATFDDGGTGLQVSITY